MVHVPLDAVELVLSEPQNGATINVAAGEEVEIRLTAQPSTGYDWQVVKGPPAVLVTHRRYDPTGLHIHTGPIGPPGEDVIDVRALGPPGRTVTLMLAYKPVSRKVAFARIWRVRFRIGLVPGVASQQPAPR